MPKIEMGKQYKTRSGLPVRILCTDRKDPKYPVIANMLRPDGKEYTESFREDGSRKQGWQEDEPNDLDLIEVKPRIKREMWLNIFHTGAYAHPSKEIADTYTTDNRIACIPITIDCEHGEGLE